MPRLHRRIASLGDLFLPRFVAHISRTQLPSPFFRFVVFTKKEPRAIVSSQSLGSKPIDNGQSHRATMSNSFDHPTYPSSPATKIQQHTRIVLAGTSHCYACRSCQAPSNAFRRQRVWMRTVRFSEFDAASQSKVIQSAKITIGRFVCTACQFTWTDYPDFRPPS